MSENANLQDLADAFSFLAEREKHAAYSAVGRRTETAALDMLAAHYRVEAYYRASYLVREWMNGRGEPLGPTVEAMAQAYRKGPSA